MPKVRTPNSGTLQINPDDLLSTYPDFYAAGDAINSSASNLHTAVINAIGVFDGNTHKQLQSLGNTCVTNLQGLANAMNEIATRLRQSALATQKVEGSNSQLF